MNLSTLFIAIVIAVSSVNLVGCGTVKQTGQGFVSGVKQDINSGREAVADFIRPNN